MKKTEKACSQEAVTLLRTIIPMVSYTNGSICTNPHELDNQQVNVLTKEALAERLMMPVEALVLSMNELIMHGIVLPIPVDHSVYYKVHPDYVPQMDYFAAQAITMMIAEHKAVQRQLTTR